MKKTVSYLLSGLCLMGILMGLFAGGLVGCQSKLKVEEDPAQVKPVLVGETVPAVSLQTTNGETVKLSEVIRKQPAVLVFYRGGWCPYCNLQLSNLRKVQGDLEKLGYQIIGVSPDKPEKLKESIAKNRLEYNLLSDHSGKAAAQFGLAFKVDEATRTKYKGYGIDLEEASGERHFTLPVPAVYLLDQKGKVNYAYYNPDYKVRLKETELLEKAREFSTK